MYDRMAFMDGFLKVVRYGKASPAQETEGSRTAQQTPPTAAQQKAKQPSAQRAHDELGKSERRIDGAS